MNVNLKHFDLSELMGALGAGESTLLSLEEESPPIFKGQAAAWAAQLARLSALIAETHNAAQKSPGFINNNPENGWTA